MYLFMVNLHNANLRGYGYMGARAHIKYARVTTQLRYNGFSDLCSTGHFARLYSNGGDRGHASIMTPPMTLTQNTVEVSFYYHMWDPELARNEMFGGKVSDTTTKEKE